MLVRWKIDGIKGLLYIYICIGIQETAIDIHEHV